MNNIFYPPSLEVTDLDRKSYQIGHHFHGPSLSKVFTNAGNSSINELQLYALLFEKFPNSIIEGKMDVKRAINWFTNKYESEISKEWNFKRRFHDEGLMQTDDNVFVLFQDLLIYFDVGQSKIRLLYADTKYELVSKLADQISAFKQIESKGETRLHFIKSGAFGSIKTESIVLDNYDVDLEFNYNTDLLPVHNYVMQSIEEQNGTGIILLYGKPGTGKTTYIRHLISQTDKPVLYFSSKTAEDLSNPNMLSLWSEFKNAICIIEDAELVLMDRGDNPSSPVAAILNMTDGFLAQCFHIQFICSFNTSLSKIDTALTRKGRLIAAYEFKALQKEKAQRLSDELGYNTTIENDMTLADIYNQEMDTFETQIPRQKIGFDMKIKTN